ncbi:tyrosinase family protein [Solirubrobacter sp. CPCC 204708]|uniref:Tyrosinase family protein n=1 Tax=Solirubrobacter deserti TaxID=2282478 RepID=A0ABT4RMA2_9ACTN|nr:tyrosinase family protein [Solirubrobacter deserti]MBE2314463.1 tyrosinase family protein [Solirubrobacter deserti]MDA0139610.1 tyrosinase family protein [Solirubrobacter deserti]
MAQYVRRDIWGLSETDPWHPIIEAYALGVRELQRPERAEPLTWAYQAKIHALPRGVAGDQFLAQCQHFCWFFLPWHRLYLYYFERIVRAAIQTLDEVDEDVKAQWALPYWNYERNDAARSLPPAFRDQTLAGRGEPNPLFIRQRKPGRNQGTPLDPNDVRSDLARLPREFAFPDGSVGGFAGPAVGPSHVGEVAGADSGELENAPHGSVHVQVGGLRQAGDPQDGLMAIFATAGLDPLFWLHHCNLDRLWEMWLGEDDAHVNPPAGSPFYAPSFHFHDEAGAAVAKTAEFAVDTAGNLEYTYEDITPPAPPRRRGRRRTTTPMSEDAATNPPEFVGGTPKPIRLAGAEERVSFETARPTGPMARRGGGRPERVYLRFEGITGEQPGITYAVYLNLPDDDATAADPEDYYVGNLAFFGVERAGDVDTDRPGGHGLNHAFDVTELVEALDDDDEWDPQEVRVTLSPVHSSGDAVRRRRGGAGPDPDAAETPAVQIGRVSVYYR